MSRARESTVLPARSGRSEHLSRRTLQHCVGLLFVAWLTTQVACETEASDATPERVVQEFIERMQHVHGDAHAARLAYELLWSDARRNLAERAKRASAVAGREIAPEEMIAPSHFTLAYQPKKFSSRVSGDWAEVTVTGDGGTAPPHVIKCVREDGRWRVVLELPPLPPIQRRVDGGI
ncbi:MAG TPA: hypothetical protein VHV51_24560 [Polyangiaceae bacterium]|nr:hypothetical protein [Polyangiaceae bacterium]